MTAATTLSSLKKGNPTILYIPEKAVDRFMSLPIFVEGFQRGAYLESNDNKSVFVFRNGVDTYRVSLLTSSLNMLEGNKVSTSSDFFTINGSVKRYEEGSDHWCGDIEILWKAEGRRQA